MKMVLFIIMRLFKAFISGMLLPSVIMPFILFYFSINNPLVLQKLPSLYFGGLAWGLWNVLFIITKKYVAINDRDRKSTRLNSSHIPLSRMPSSA